MASHQIVKPLTESWTRQERAMGLARLSMVAQALA